MTLLDEIRSSNKKPKELLSYLAEKAKKDKNILSQIPACFQCGNTTEKGIAMEIMEYVSKDRPELVRPFIKNVIDYLNDEAPRVKWEAARVIGNIAHKYPDEVTKAIEKLMINTKDKGTVVRWSAAFALGEIVKHNTKTRSSLVPQIEKILKKETNNGVKNVYLKALKAG